MSQPSAHLRIVRDDETAAASIDDLFRRRARFVSGIAYRMLGRDDEIDDVVQDVFMQVHRQRDRLRGDDLDGLLATMTVRAVGRKLRWRRARRFVGLLADVDYDPAVAPDTDPDTRLLLSRVYAALDTVPARQRLAWTLRHIEGVPLALVAERCGCSLATAKRRIADAHDKISKKVGAAR